MHGSWEFQSYHGSYAGLPAGIFESAVMELNSRRSVYFKCLFSSLYFEISQRNAACITLSLLRVIMTSIFYVHFLARYKPYCMENLAFDSHWSDKSDWTMNSHYITHTFSFWAQEWEVRFFSTKNPPHMTCQQHFRSMILDTFHGHGRTNCMQFVCKNNSRLGKAVLLFEGWLTR